MSALERYCDKVLWLDQGQLKAYGDVQPVMGMYMEHVAELQRANLLIEHAGGAEDLRSSRRKRWGSREAEIVSVELFNGTKKPCYLYKTGDKMTIEIIYKTYCPIEDPVFGVGIFRNDETYCYGTNTHIEKIPIPRINGEGTVKFRIDRLDLTEGKYFLDIAIHTEDGIPYDYQTHSYSFEVMSMIKDLGVYRPAHKWEIE
jgi:lipopolysaccharide transport system ATP-binding protein